jgi:hypothetical protein
MHAVLILTYYMQIYAGLKLYTHKRKSLTSAHSDGALVTVYLT